MPTTVHVPPALLKLVDQRARSLGVSRNRLVVQALERVVNDRSGWAPEFLHRLRNADATVAEAVDQLAADVTSARRSKRPPVL
jgi:EAL domain-containing protein (putative c-di-GMP-specific phosphodiesterase class I)